MPRAESPYREVYASLAEINRFRVSLGLQPVVSAKVTCLSCGREFRSEDVQRVRVCRSCKSSLEREAGFHDTYAAGNMKGVEHFSVEMLSPMVW